MAYKVFLVEDEIVTREGIRDNVNWGKAGFEFCGEASDGEIALPLIEEMQPDVLITDIKMPFMDGLQLSKIVREHMPWVKIIILSGHNEFEYAQSAVKLGVTEYLLKPVSAQDLVRVLGNLSASLEQERLERENLKRLQNKMEDNLVFSREKFLLKLIMGGISSADAIEQSQLLGLDIIARYYLVVFIRIELCKSSQPFDYHEYQQVEDIISEYSGNNPDVIMTKKDPEELILLMKGGSREQLVQEGSFLTGLLKNEVEDQTSCSVIVEIGSPQRRLGDLHHSFTEAIIKSKSDQKTSVYQDQQLEQDILFNIDHLAVENYLKFGSSQEFDAFYQKTIEPLVDAALRSYLLKHYLFLDIILTTTQFVSNLDGEIDGMTMELQELEKKVLQIDSDDNIRYELEKIFLSTLAFRDSQTHHTHKFSLQQTKSYIDDSFTQSDLKMEKVAEKYSISTGHFSTSFKQEFGITFRDYVSKLRINKAKELLRTTNIKCSDIAFQCGYNDAHYFSFVFKKKTGVSPQQFRSESQSTN